MLTVSGARADLMASRVALAILAGAVHCLADGSNTVSSLANITCSQNDCSLWAYINGGNAVVPLRLSFYAPQIVRWWLAIDGNFSDTGAASDVIVGGAQPVTAVLVDAGEYYNVTQASSSTPSVSVRLQKSPLLLSIFVDGALVAAEAAPLTWNSTSSWQTLARDVAPLAPGLSSEWFFGAGMQHGRFSHRDSSVTIGVDYNWDDGGHPNSAPWYVTTGGYGVLRNTWAPGVYSFASPVITAHNESNRLDAFFLVVGPSSTSIRDVLSLYTGLTGPPFLPPLYALFAGDSDCYHNDRHGNSTQVAIAVADLYQQYDMPHGWMLPNDGTCAPCALPALPVNVNMRCPEHQATCSWHCAHTHILFLSMQAMAVGMARAPPSSPLT